MGVRKNFWDWTTGRLTLSEPISPRWRFLKAQRGLYSNFEVQMGLNVRTILDCFHKDGEQWMVNDDIRKMVEFRRYNLLDDIALTDKFEVIFCRNVLRFFTPEYQRQILARLSNSQTQGEYCIWARTSTFPVLMSFTRSFPDTIAFICLAASVWQN
ncbi:MAG: CheR family methyltransferase [Alphaproteobacteria bacterium]